MPCDLKLSTLKSDGDTLWASAEKTLGLGLGCVANDVMLANANGHQIRENMLISQWIFPSKGGCFRHESTSRPIVGLFHMPQYVAQKMGFIYLTLLNIYVHMTL